MPDFRDTAPNAYDQTALSTSTTAYQMNAHRHTRLFVYVDDGVNDALFNYDDGANFGPVPKQTWVEVWSSEKRGSTGNTVYIKAASGTPTCHARVA